MDIIQQLIEREIDIILTFIVHTFKEINTNLQFLYSNFTLKCAASSYMIKGENYEKNVETLLNACNKKRFRIMCY